MKFSVDWENDDRVVTVSRDGKPVAVGTGKDRPTALHDAWTTLVDLGETDVAARVAKSYHAATGQDPVR